MRAPSLIRRVAACALVTATSLAAQNDPPFLFVPPGNPITPEKVMLGKALFWDEQLSSTGTVACGTCHRPSAGGSDPRTRDARHPGYDGVFGTDDDGFGSFGVIQSTADGRFTGTSVFGANEQVTPRMAPTVINAARFEILNWDGRAEPVFIDPSTGFVIYTQNASLESQASGPPVDTVEMAHIGEDWGAVAARIATLRPLALATDIPADLAQWIGTQTYEDLFTLVFGVPDVSSSTILASIATYQRTLISDQAPIDLGTIPPETAEGRGFALFNGGALCFACHDLENATAAFFNTGIRPAFEDTGRGAISGFPIDMGRFKVPFLRNLDSRPAFFHNGSAETLSDVIDFYDQGGNGFAPPGEPMFQLFLTDDEKSDLLAFLQNSLTDPRVAAELPPFDRPTLFTETDQASTAFGQGAHGTLGIVPRLVALEPPYLGNPNFTIGLADAAGGMPAALLIDTAPGDGSLLFEGVPLNVGVTGSLAVLELGTLPGDLWGEGFWSVSFPIPNVPGLDGTSLYFQGLVIDFGTPAGWAGTRGLETEFYSPF